MAFWDDLGDFVEDYGNYVGDHFTGNNSKMNTSFMKGVKGVYNSVMPAIYGVGDIMTGGAVGAIVQTRNQLLGNGSSLPNYSQQPYQNYYQPPAPANPVEEPSDNKLIFAAGGGMLLLIILLIIILS